MMHKGHGMGMGKMMVVDAQKHRKMMTNMGSAWKVLPSGRIKDPPRLGSGARFKALKGKLAKRKGVTDPGALTAYIGRKKYGKKKFAKLSSTGRRRRSRY